MSAAGDSALKPLIEMMAGYNQWANRRLYEAVARLRDADYRADRGAFFGSLHGTLNHLLGTDRIWMRRFTGTGEAPDRLDSILHPDFDGLRRAREAEDRRIRDYVAALSAADLAGVIRYRTISAPAEISQALAPALLHFFNHQTHHRGQAHALLTGIAGEAPSLDLILYQRETGIGLAS
ncbi:MAG: DinB family protein [Hyphomicrobium sp.]|uniref:DinB family protein n=1 Tax=Hyphomicrobium sp. TaxID=82 RepID=UPI003D0F416D